VQDAHDHSCQADFLQRDGKRRDKTNITRTKTDDGKTAKAMPITKIVPVVSFGAESGSSKSVTAMREERIGEMN
jgi:hypothetical protein